MELVFTRAKQLINWVDIGDYFTGVWVYLILATIPAPWIFLVGLAVMSSSPASPQAAISSADLRWASLATLGIMVVGSSVLSGWWFLPHARQKRKENPSWRGKH